MGNVVIDQLKEAAGVLETFINDQAAIDCIERAAQVMADCIKSGGKIMTCGNGGSLCDAMHFAEELTGKFRAERIPLPAFHYVGSCPHHLRCQ
jgi:D-sedoheptulose 7-phosphate isomerase